MRCEVVKPAPKFEPVKIMLVFESQIDITGKVHGFAGRFDSDSESSHSRMSCDPTCQKIREALLEVGY